MYLTRIASRRQGLRDELAGADCLIPAFLCRQHTELVFGVRLLEEFRRYLHLRDRGRKVDTEHAKRLLLLDDKLVTDNGDDFRTGDGRWNGLPLDDHVVGIYHRRFFVERLGRPTFDYFSIRRITRSLLYPIDLST